MKIDRNKLKWFMTKVRTYAERDGIELTDEYIANEMAGYMEVNPSCVNMDESNREGRYYYSTVGYGVFSLLGERYRMGRIEIFDRQNDSGYQIDEGTYCMPFEAANQFEDFIESLETDLPINIEIGTHEACDQATAEDLGIPVDKLHDADTKKAYYQKKNDEYARTKGYKDFDELVANSKFGKKQNEE